jgi:hypothetical protein
MCATVLAPQIMITQRLANAALHQGSNFRPAEHREDREQPLSMRWVAVIDEHGNRALRMRWTVTPSSVSSTLCKVKAQYVQPALCWEGDPTPGPQVGVAIS